MPEFRIAHWRGSPSLRELQSRILEHYPDATLIPGTGNCCDELELEIDPSKLLDFCTRFGPIAIFPPGRRKEGWFMWVTNDDFRQR